MKIAMMTNNYKPFVGGVPISVERLAGSLRQRGHSVTVFAPSYREQEEQENVVRYHSFYYRREEGMAVPDSFDPRIEQQFVRGQFDLIHVHHPMMIGQTAMYLSRKHGVPLVFTYHTRYEQYLHYLGLSGLKELVAPCVRAFAIGCDAVIAPTPGMKAYLEEIGVKTAVHALPTGLLEDSFAPDESRAQQLRAELAGKKRHLFVSVARLAKEKNIDFLLESLAIRKRKGADDFRLALLGEGPEKKHLQELAQRLNLSENVVFAGCVENAEIKNYCRAADLFLFASKTETQGIVSLEAMAAGTPVLAVRASGTEDIVVDGVNGYMTEESAEAFEKRLEAMLSAEELERLSAGAVKTARRYSADEVAGRALGCYAEAIRARDKKASVDRMPARISYGRERLTALLNAHRR